MGRDGDIESTAKKWRSLLAGCSGNAKLDIDKRRMRVSKMTGDLRQ